MPIPREERNAINRLITSATIPSAAIPAQAGKIEALANMMARFDEFGAILARR